MQKNKECKQKNRFIVKNCLIKMMESKNILPFMNKNNGTKNQKIHVISTCIFWFFNRSKDINLTLVHRIKRF